jgi:hypothetical protein
MARIDKNMGNASYNQRHAHQPGVQALRYNRPWRFIRKNIFILGAAAYNTSLPPVGRPRPFQSTARVDEVIGNASYDRRHVHRLGVQAIVHNQPWQFIMKNIFILGAAAYDTSLPPVGLALGLLADLKETREVLSAC